MKKIILFSLTLVGCINPFNPDPNNFFCERTAKYSFGRQCLDTQDKCKTVSSSCVEYKVVYCTKKISANYSDDTTVCLATNAECEKLIATSNNAFDKCFVADQYDVSNPDYIRTVP